MRRSRATIILASAMLLGGAVVGAADAGQPTTVDIWLADRWPGHLDWAQAKAAEFNAAHPGYKISIQGHDLLELPRKVTEAAARGEAPDVAEYYYSATQEALDADAADGTPLFVPVEKAIKGRKSILGEKVVTGDIMTTAKKYYTYHGQLAAMPRNISTTLQYVNMDILTAAGVKNPPRTWGELAEACRAIDAAPNAPQNCMTWANHGWFFEQAVSTQNVQLADCRNGREGPAKQVHLNSSAMLDWVRWWTEQNQIGNYVLTGQDVGGDWIGARKAFADKKVAFLFSSSVETDPIVQDGVTNGFQVRTTDLPHKGDSRNAGNVLGGDAMWLQAGLDRPTENGALAFMQFINTPERAADWSKQEASGFMPVTKAGAEQLRIEGDFDKNPHKKVAIDQLNRNSGTDAALGAFIGDFYAMQDIMSVAMVDILTGRAPVAERFAKADSDSQRLLDAYNQRNHSE